MESKKNPSADLNRKRSFFFSIASLITMSLVLFAFEFKHHELPIEEIVQRNTDEFDNTIVPVTQITPPAPKIVAPTIVEVSKDEEINDEIKFDLHVDTSPDTHVEPIVLVHEEPEKPSDEIVVYAEESATPRGGFENFYKYLYSNIKYPAQAQRMQTQGKVFR